MFDPTEIRRRLSAFTLLGEGDVGVLYDRDALDLKPLGGELAAVLGDVLARSETLAEDAAEWADLATLIDQVAALPGLDGLSGAVPRSRGPARPVEPVRGRLFKLAISVAETCNLACSYCYANRGLFERPTGRLMPPDVAERVVENALARFDVVQTVQFIGGEPTVNLPAVERVCRTFARAVDAGRLRALPRFVITTNGLRPTTSLVELAHRYGLRPTVSLDGPREIHDGARVGPDGSGSYDRIRAHIEELRAADVPVEFEATFSRLHLRAGMHLIDLCHWFRDELGERVLHAPPVSAGAYTPADLTLSMEEQIAEYCAAAEWTVDNLLIRDDWMGHSFAARVLQALATRSRSPSVCSAGRDLLCVAGDGAVYPCWMYIGEADMRLGSFLEPAEGPWDWSRVAGLLGPGDLDAHADCRTCFARGLCFGCRAADFRATGDVSGKPACALTQGIIASVLLRIFSAPRPGERPPASAADYLSRPPFGARLFGLTEGSAPA
jgi:uncharacterized protein